MTPDLMTPGAARAEIRAGRFTGTTAGLAPGALQANLVVLPAAEAEDFARFCAANPKPCPLLAQGRPGDPSLPSLGEDIDLRHDLPGYRIWRDGALSAQVTDIAALWRDDLVSFPLGCSFGFEATLMAAGIGLRHIEDGKIVSMYDTDLALEAVGPFGGRMVVSMRPVPEDRLDEVVAISGRFPLCHGTPVHAGDPADIGIADIGRPDYGDATDFRDGEVPVFWACGVTPQQAIRRSRLPFAITHEPGKMLICDAPAGDA